MSAWELSGVSGSCHVEVGEVAGSPLALREVAQAGWASLCIHLQFLKMVATLQAPKSPY